MKKPTIKPATEQDVANQKKTVKNEKAEDREELKLKKDQLKDKKARLRGGFSPIIKREYMPLDEEMKLMEEEKKLKEIEYNEFIPLTPYWRFEINEEWQRIQKQRVKRVIDNKQKVIEQMQEHKEKITQEIPELQKRINELEKKLGLKLSNFKTEKVDYIG